MGRIEIDDRGRDSFSGVGGNACGGQTFFEISHQPFMDGLPLGQHPDAERRIEIVHSFEQPPVELRRIEQQRVNASAFGELDHAFDVDFDSSDVDADHQPLRDEAVISGLLEHGPQFADDLAQRGTRLFLVRTAPEQANQPLAALLLRLRQRKITEDRSGLAGPQFDRPAVEPHAEPPDQRHRQTRSAFGRRRGVVCCYGIHAGRHTTVPGTGWLIPASLYQRDTPGIGCAASRLRNRVLQPGRDDFGWLELQAGGDHADHRNSEALARQVNTECIDSELLQTLDDQTEYGALFSCVEREMIRLPRNRLQQFALIGIDRRALQMDAILGVERIIAALNALGCDDGIGQFELTHFQNRGADRGLQRRPRREAESKTGAVRPARDRRDAGHADIRRDVEQPCPALHRCAMPEPPQQIFRHGASFVMRRNRSGQSTAPPPQARGARGTC